MSIFARGGAPARLASILPLRAGMTDHLPVLPRVLILAHTPLSAERAGNLARAVGCIAVMPRDNESGSAALLRRRPSVALVELDRAELADDRFVRLASSVGARV